MDNKKLLTRKEVAAKFSVDPETVKRWERTGKLPIAGKISNKPRYSSADVDNLLVKDTPKK